jgi:hypothetical protein
MAGLPPDKLFRFSAGATLMVMQRTQQFSSPGTDAISNYQLQNGSPVIAAFGRVARRQGKYELGGELSLMSSFGNEGVKLANDTMAEPLSWTWQLLDLRALVGYHAAPGWVVSARIGYRSMATTIDVNTTIKQPSERLTGYALGGEAVASNLYPKLIARVGVETLLGAELLQTTGLEDGAEATVTPYSLFAEGSYELAPKTYGVASYSLSYETYSFTGTSVRNAANSEGERKDLQHLFGVGVLYWF